jgi:PAS domain S-box-containing protein
MSYGPGEHDDERAVGVVAPTPWAALDTAADLIALFDRAHRFVYVNQAVEALTGQPRSELLGRTPGQVALPAEVAQIWQQGLERVFESDGPTELEFFLQSADGPRWLEARLSPETDPQGEVTGVLAIIRDITDSRTRRLLEEAVRRLPAGICLVDAPSGRTLLKNDEADRIFGRSPGPEWPPKGDEDEWRGFHSDGRPYRAEEWPLARSIATGEVVTGEEIEILRPDGSAGTLRVSSAPVRQRDGRISAGVVIFDDITAARRAERGQALLAEATALLTGSLEADEVLRRLARLAVPAVADWCMIQVRDEGQVRTVALEHSDPKKRALALEMIDRYPPERNRHQGVARVLGGGPAELFPEIPEPILAAAAQDAQHLHYLKAVGYRSAMVVPLCGRTGVLGALTFASVDAARRYGPEDLALAEDLGRRAALAVENARLFEAEQQARTTAQEAERRKDEFLALLGHEMRNPLAPILTALQLMKIKGEAGERERAVIERQVDHLRRLVDDLLDVSRFTRGKIDLKKAPVEMAAVVGKAIEIAGPLLERRRHHLTVSAPARGLLIEADEVRMAQVIANLLTNAGKYTPEGGSIGLAAEREGEWIVVRVIDNGIGIPPEALPSLFEPFVQGARSLDRAEGGLGLGLTLVRTLVELHGGAVAASSAGRGQGSTFVVRVPAVTRPLVAPTAVEPIVAAGPAQAGATAADLQRVLIVDDNADAAEALAETLRVFGHDVRVALDGPEALAVAREFQPQVALLDIGLPVMDGYELAEHLRREQAGPPLRLVALTGYGQERDKARSKEAGFDLHLVKPVDIQDLKKAIGVQRH